jgi:transcriptional regulator with XRE-family HTH domain
VGKNTRGYRLRIARERLGLTQGEAAQKVGLALSTYSSKERAQSPKGRDFKWEEAKDLAKHLNVDAHWLYSGEGNTPELPAENVSASSLTVVSLDTTGIIGWFGEPTGEGSLYGFDSERIRRPCFARPETVAVEVKGRGIGEGMLAFFDDERQPLAPGVKGLTILGLADRRILIRKVSPCPTAPTGFTIEPYGEGQEHVDPAKVEWAAPVIAILPR